MLVIPLHSRVGKSQEVTAPLAATGGKLTGPEGCLGPLCYIMLFA